MRNYGWQKNKHFLSGFIRMHNNSHSIHLADISATGIRLPWAGKFILSDIFNDCAPTGRSRDPAVPFNQLISVRRIIFLFTWLTRVSCRLILRETAVATGIAVPMISHKISGSASIAEGEQPLDLSTVNFIARRYRLVLLFFSRHPCFTPHLLFEEKILILCVLLLLL